MLRSYSDISPVRVDWLWYPYIAYGKITVLQGNPGDGKSHVGIQLAAALSSKGMLPNGTRLPGTQHVIYQCAEDGLADTIKPRLIDAGADCSNVAFLDDEILTLDDEKIREAIVDYGARLLVIDPLQAYLGNSDISSASSIRRIMNRLCRWAGIYNCAVLIIGHLNKKESANDLYRGLGSIDVTAAARSVLQLDQNPYYPDIKVIRHVKSSLAAKGDNVMFRIIPGHGLEWIHDCEADENSSEIKTEVKDLDISKQETVARLIKDALKEGPVSGAELLHMFINMGIGMKTVRNVKSMLGIQSVRKDNKWFWVMPEKGASDGAI